MSVILPGLIFGLGTSWWLAADMRQATDDAASRLTFQTSENLAEYLRSTVIAMKVLARSPSLERRNLSEFHKFATLLSADLGQHIGLATADGRQIFNTRARFGTKLPARAEATSYTRALQTGQPSVSNIIIGAIAQKPLVTVDVPVVTSWGPVVLATSTDLAVIANVVARTKLDEDWKMAVLDGEGRFIARSQDSERYVGKLAVPELVAVAKSRQRSGRLRHANTEGADVVSFFHKVPGTDWTIVTGTPEPVFLAPLRGTLAALAAAGSGTIAITLLLAYTLGWRLNRAVCRLSDAAVALERGEVPPPPNRLIAEFENVGQMLHHAAVLIQTKQNELTAARDQAERLGASKARFFAAANHDLRQPLQAMGLFLNVLCGMSLDARQRQVVEQLTFAHANMSDQINVLMDLAKLDNGGLVPQLAPVAVTALMGEIAAECRLQAEAKGLRLQFHAAADVTIQTDKTILGRIVRNLIHNAIRYTEKGGIVVAVRRRPGYLALEVWDSGLGIAADKLDLIWEECFQVGNQSRDQSQGLGLGLAIVSRLIRLLDFNIEVHSRLGRGSLFRLKIPLSAVA